MNRPEPAISDWSLGRLPDKRKTLVLLVIGLGSLMSATDNAATYLIVPIVQQDFAASVAAVQWISIAYFLTVSGLLLPFGRLGDLWGLRRVYLTGILVFAFSSFLCAVAPAITYLIVFRAFEAVGAAMLTSAAPAILTRSYPADRSGRVLGLQLVMTYLGLTMGPFIGGFVAAWWSWRGVFWINIIVSSGLLIFAYRILPDLGGSPQGRFDFVGALTLIAAVFLVMIGVTGVGEVEVSARLWNLLRVGLVAAGLLFGLVFVARERRLEAAGKQPLVPLSLFSNGFFSLSAGLCLVGYTCEFFIIFSLPFYLIRVLGLSSAEAGFLFMAKSLLMIVVAPISGDLSDRTGPRSLSVASMLAFAGTFLLLFRLPEDAGLTVVVVALLLSGAASGLFVSPNNSAMIGLAPSETKGVVSAMIGLARYFGMVFGTAFSGALLALHPQNLLAGFHLAMGVGGLLALGGLIVGTLQAPKAVGEPGQGR